MFLNGIVVNINHFLELLQRHIPDVILSVHEEASEDVYTENAEALVGLDAHDGSGAL